MTSSPGDEQFRPGTRAVARLLRARWVVRAPIWLFRARLGFLFGSRLLLLEHTGRRSGACRHVALEIVSHPRPGTYIVASGFGTRAQWFRNVSANPGVRVWVSGRRPAQATARLLTGEEVASALDEYAGRHPRAWAALKPVFEATLGTRIAGGEPGLPMVCLALADGPRGT